MSFVTAQWALLLLSEKGLQDLRLAAIVSGLALGGALLLAGLAYLFDCSDRKSADFREPYRDGQMPVVGRSDENPKDFSHYSIWIGAALGALFAVVAESEAIQSPKADLLDPARLKAFWIVAELTILGAVVGIVTFLAIKLCSSGAVKPK